MSFQGHRARRCRRRRRECRRLPADPARSDRIRRPVPGSSNRAPSMGNSGGSPNWPLHDFLFSVASVVSLGAERIRIWSPPSASVHMNAAFEENSQLRGSFFFEPPRELREIEMHSPLYYGACTLGGIASCGLTHMAVTPLDLVKCNMQVRFLDFWAHGVSIGARVP